LCFARNSPIIDTFGEKNVGPMFNNSPKTLLFKIPHKTWWAGGRWFEVILMQNVRE